MTNVESLLSAFRQNAFLPAEIPSAGGPRHPSLRARPPQLPLRPDASPCGPAAGPGAKGAGGRKLTLFALVGATLVAIVVGVLGTRGLVPRVQPGTPVRGALEGSVRQASSDRGAQADAGAAAPVCPDGWVVDSPLAAVKAEALNQRLDDVEALVRVLQAQTALDRSYGEAGVGASLPSAEISQLAATLLSVTSSVAQLRRELDALIADTTTARKDLAELRDAVGGIARDVAQIDVSTSDFDTVKARALTLQKRLAQQQ